MLNSAVVDIVPNFFVGRMENVNRTCGIDAFNLLAVDISADVISSLYLPRLVTSCAKMKPDKPAPCAIMCIINSFYNLTIRLI